MEKYKIYNYKGYWPIVQYDSELNVLIGRICGIDDMITFKCQSVDEIRKTFEDAVNEYLAICEKIGKKPEKPLSGKLLVRIDPSIQREISNVANMARKSVNRWVCDVITNAIASTRNTIESH